MELHSLELRNFRQFTSASLQFARGGDRGVTVVHGSNGSGKTTLLNAFTWLFYDDVDFETRPERLVNEGAIADAATGDNLTVSVCLTFEHESTEYRATRVAVYEKRSNTDFDGELTDMEVTVEYKQDGSWAERGNPENSLDQIVPERLSSLFFFDGEDIDELAGVQNQDRIQESIQNIMGLTILERATRHLDKVAGRFEDEVEEHASEELSNLIEEKRSVEEEIDDLKRDSSDTARSKERVETEIRDIDQKLDRLDESAALQERRNQHEATRNELQNQVEDVNEQIKHHVDTKSLVPLAMPIIRETAAELDEMRKEGVIPSELSNGYIDSLLEAEQCICGRPLEPGTDHYELVQAMKGDTIADGVEQSALRIIGHLNQMSEMESTFFDRIDELVEERKELHDEIAVWNEKIDDVSSALQEMDQTTESGESISDLEQRRTEKKQRREDLINELGRIDERIEQKEDRAAALAERINEQRDEREEAMVAKRRQRGAELVRDELDDAFELLKDKVRKLSNEKIQDTFDSIATKDFTAKVTKGFELKIRQDVGGNSMNVDKSTGERQIASLAFIGSLVDIARERYEADSDSDYFTGGIYPLVMDSPFGALDKDHRREVSRVIPVLANQVVVFATDSQWEGPVEDEMRSMIGEEYWMEFEDGSSDGEYPHTRIKNKAVAVRSD